MDIQQFAAQLESFVLTVVQDHKLESEDVAKMLVDTVVMLGYELDEIVDLIDNEILGG